MTVDNKTEIHLVVLQHGMWGTSAQMDYIEKALVEQWDEKIHVMNAKSNSHTFTYDGIDVCGERLANEILEECEKLQESNFRITKISVIAYSQGGLTSRYALGVLHSYKFFDKIEPVNFVTFATPHLGVWQPYETTYSRVYNYVSPRVLARTGEHISLTDSSDSQGRPLLLIMSDPSHIFSQALALFRNHSCYANIASDRTVPYWSASFSGVDPFRNLEAVEIEYDKKYPCLVVSYTPCNSDPVSLQKRFIEKGPRYLALGVMGPLWAAAALSSMSIQAQQSRYRVSTMKRDSCGKILDETVIAPNVDNLNIVPEEIVTDGTTLNLTDTQKKIIKNLRKIKWKKYSVHCRGVFNAHGGIIIRSSKYDNDDGKIAVKHCIENLEV